MPMPPTRRIPLPPAVRLIDHGGGRGPTVDALGRMALAGAIGRIGPFRVRLDAALTPTETLGSCDAMMPPMIDVARAPIVVVAAVVVAAAAALDFVDAAAAAAAAAAYSA